MMIVTTQRIMLSLIFLLFLPTTILAFKKQATLQISVSQGFPYSLDMIEKVELIGENIHKTKNLTYDKVIFENLKKGKYKLIFHEKNRIRKKQFEKEFIIKRNKKYSVSYTLDSLYENIKNKNIFQNLLNLKSEQVKIHTMTLIGCTSIIHEEITIFKVKNKITGITYTCYGDNLDCSIFHKKITQLTDSEVLKKFIEFEEKVSHQKLDYSAGYSGGTVNEMIIFIGKQMKKISFCPPKFNEFEKLKQEIRREW